MRAAIYARVSTGNQAAQDISIPDQIARCEEYCVDKDWQVAKNYVDAGASATDDNRADFQAMIAEACSPANPFDVVIVHSQSRFARNTLDLLHYTNKLEKAGVQFVSITQDLGQGEQAGVLRTILGAMDEYQSKETSKHTSRSMRENTRQGFWNGSQPPFGYRTYVAEKRGKKDKKKLEIAPHEAEIVKMIFRHYVTGDGTSGPMGLRAVAYDLNERGETTRKGGKFLQQFIQRVLTNEIYVGRYHFNKKDKNGNAKPEDQWVFLETPRIVGDEVFHAANERLRRNTPFSTPPRVVNGPTLLTGVAHCKQCGSPMRIATGKSGRYRYYKCGRRADAGRAVCPGCSVPMQKLDDAVITTLCNGALSQERIEIIVPELVANAQKRSESYDQRLDHLRDEQRAVKNQLKELWRQISITEISLDATLQKYIKELQDKAEDLNRAIRRLEQQQAFPVRNLSRNDCRAFAAAVRNLLKENKDPKFTRVYLSHIVSRVDVSKDEIRMYGPKVALAEQAIAFDSTKILVPTFDPKWCPWPDSNWHSVKNRILSRARLPIQS
tara:strand:+ start:481 stop:2139 length:1659 start_codon:yes stop_codon:yes gene_type:complete